MRAWSWSWSLAALVAVTATGVMAENRARLDAGWIVADVEIQPDGSTRFLELEAWVLLGEADIEAAINALQFPPQVRNGEAITYRTGLYLRCHIVQNGRMRQIVFGRAFLSPLMRSTSPPDWPGDTWEAGVGGEVILHAQIDTDGAVSAAKIIAGDAADVFHEPALAAVREMRFEPVLVNGEPEASVAIVDVYFEPAPRKLGYEETAAIVPLVAGNPEFPWPEYRDDLPYWRDYEDVDDDLVEAVDAWELPGMPADAQGIPAVVIHRRLVSPGEARMVLLPDTSAASREEALR